MRAAVPVTRYQAITTELLRWFDQHARDLPWRGSDDPYAILVSEIMSQQTRVETVRDYWTRWIEVFPTVASLADAPEDRVMAQWAGLGYYRRARNLHAAARRIVEQHDGEVPGNVEGLRDLPGVGAYTAGAVASIAFGETVPAVDGNVTRVVSRLFAIGGEPHRVAFKRAIEAEAAEIVDLDRPGDTNEALMELGATVCTPRSPSCDACPLAAFCEAYSEGQQADFPPKKRKTRQRDEKRVTVVPVFDTEVFVRKRPEEGLLGGTWEFPTFGVSTPEDAEKELASQHGLSGEFEAVGDVAHIFSHIRMTYRVWLLVGAERSAGRGGRWLSVDELDAVALSTAMRKVARRAGIAET